MRALTVWQPWASLIAWKEKHYETRGWATQYRGLVAIHAALNRDMTDELYRTNSYYRAVFERRGLVRKDGAFHLREGVVVAIAELKAVEKTEHLWVRGLAGGKITQQEKEFGDWGSGRYAWEMANVRELIDPIPAFGNQGLWEWRMKESEAERLPFVKG